MIQSLNMLSYFMIWLVQIIFISCIYVIFAFRVLLTIPLSLRLLSLKGISSNLSCINKVLSFSFLHLLNVLVKMATDSSICRNNLKCQILEKGFTMIFSCNYCTCLNKFCVKLEDSACCSECIYAYQKCVNTQSEFSEAEWKQLI